MIINQKKQLQKIFKTSNTNKKTLVLDTDVISSFAWIKRLDIIIKLYSPNLVLLDVVEGELSNTPHLMVQVDKYIDEGKIKFIELELYSSMEGLKYACLRRNIETIGIGEAACMAYCRYNNYILGSNNFRDILEYCEEHEIEIKTTKDILIEAYENSLIDENEGNKIWKEMKLKQRKLPCETFSDALRNRD